MARLRGTVTLRPAVLLILLFILLWLASACSTTAIPDATTASAIPEQSPPTATGAPAGSSSVPVVAGPTESTASAQPRPVREGTTAASAQDRFVPQSIELPSGENAVVEPEPTVNGVLQIPDDIRHVGWWDGSAYAGDPFGSTVIAGHVDSRLQGLGFFAQLLLIQVGDLITLRSDTQALTYRVVSATLISKEALASDGQAFDQHGPHRLVLITCSGQWHPEVRSYDSNLVVVADPVIH
jgi:LPXTG-site transpeptidase (sortase) family protein